MSSMQDVMRGESMPRYVLDVPRLEARLGAPLGADLIALSELACRIAPFSPWSAFEALDVSLPYLFASEPERHAWTPDTVVTFVDTGVDMHQAGFVVRDGTTPLSECPIAMVTHEPRVVAKNLAAFLGLVAFAGAEALAYDVTPTEWRELREQRLTDDEFRTSSETLLGLSGVKLSGPARRKSSPFAALTRLFGRKTTTEEVATVGLARVRQLLRSKERMAARRELARQIEICVGIPDLVPGERWPELQELIDTLRPALPESARAELTRRGVHLRR